ncbi:MAG: TadE/TadG family type IV pilus assembly protein [Planctomycetota bacterium]
MTGGDSATAIGTRHRCARGGVMVEFALVALVLYLLLAALLSFGTMVQAAQVAQDVARLAARELALTPLPPDATFEEALAATSDRIFDPDQLVVDVQGVWDAGLTLDQHFATLPLVNRALRPVFVTDRVGGRTLLRFPGALVTLPVVTGFNDGKTVAVPQVVSRTAGVETIRWLPVVEEIRSDRNDPATGPFSAASTAVDRGLVALRINIPATASALASYDAPVTWPPEPNAHLLHRIGEGEIVVEPGAATPTGALVGSEGAHVLRGDYGLGEMGALTAPVRPFRRVFIGQALFRREVFQ